MPRRPTIGAVEAFDRSLKMLPCASCLGAATAGESWRSTMRCRICGSSLSERVRAGRAALKEEATHAK